MLPDMPNPSVDPDPPRAPGGVDATLNEADPGSTVSAEIAPQAVIPDPPFSAQEDEKDMPEEIKERDEETDEVPDDPEQAQVESTTEEPSD